MTRRFRSFYPEFTSLAGYTTTAVRCDTEIIKIINNQPPCCEIWISCFASLVNNKERVNERSNDDVTFVGDICGIIKSKISVYGVLLRNKIVIHPVAEINPITSSLLPGKFVAHQQVL